MGLAVGLRLPQFLEYFGITEEGLRTAIGDPDPKAKKKIDPLVYSGSYWLAAYSIDELKIERLLALLKSAEERA